MKNELTKNIDRNILEEAYNVYLTLNNFLDKESYVARKNAFMDKLNISIGTLKKYVRTYAITYLNMTLDEINQEIRTIDTNIYHISSNADELDAALSFILNSDDDKEIKKLIVKYHISPYMIKKRNNDLAFKNQYQEYIDLLIKKVEQAIKELEQDHIYIHYSVALSRLEKVTSSEEIKAIIKNNRDLVRPQQIRFFLFTYRMTLSEKEKDILKESLVKKIDIVKEETNLVKKEIAKKNKEESVELYLKQINFKAFLSKEINSTLEFCSIMNITNYTFKQGLLFLEKTDNTLYLEIKKKLSDLKKEKYLSIVTQTNRIVNEIINGISLEDGSKREFEILDFYLETNLDFKSFLDACLKKSQPINKDQFKIIRTFINKNKLYTKINIDKELKGTNIIMIDGKLHEVKEQEKIETIDFLNEHNIPLYVKLYRQALKRHITGNLLITNCDEKTLIKSNKQT